MKRILCLALCLMLTIPCVLAETADTLPKLFMRQLSGGNGNGARGYISIKASGVAEWLDMLLPFTASDIQIRAIGEKQGEASDTVTDDDDWQVKFYVKDDQGAEKSVSWLYGDPAGVYFQSELIPDTRLAIPVEDVHLLYQLFRGDFADLFFAFDPMNLMSPGANGNASAYKAVADVLEIPEDEWQQKWLPVLEKYFLQLDLWMAGFSEATVANTEDGGLTMSTAYKIPAGELKDEAKYIIGQMLYDNDLQSLLIPLVTMEQRITYLNPQMVYFYEACIDAMELKGDIILSREMSALGEVVKTTLELPLPKLPETLTKDTGIVLKNALELPYADLLSDVNRISITQEGKMRSVVLSAEERTVTVAAEASMNDAGAQTMAGIISIVPSQGKDEMAYSAAFSCGYSHQIWQDEKYLDHDTTSFSLQIEPDMVTVENGFQPVGIEFSVDYRHNPYKPEGPAQVNINVKAQMPDATVDAEVVLRITTQMHMEDLPKTGSKDISMMRADERAALLHEFVNNAMDAMSALYEMEADEPGTETVADTPAAPEQTDVPSVSE